MNRSTTFLTASLLLTAAAAVVYWQMNPREQETSTPAPITRTASSRQPTQASIYQKLTDSAN